MNYDHWKTMSPDDERQAVVSPTELRDAARSFPDPEEEAEVENTGSNAADAIDYCARAAELLRSQANSMKSLAATLEAEAEALALDIEKRAERFATMVRLFSTVSGQMRETFEAERARFDKAEVTP